MLWTGEAIAQELEISLDDIASQPYAPRLEHDADELQRLAKSMQDHEQLQPVGVRKSPGRSPAKPWQLLYGDRRLRAARLAGWTSIKVRVLDCRTDLDALAVIGAENLIRRNWNTIEKAQYLELLGTPKGRGGAGLTNKQIGNMFSRSETWSINLRRLLRLPANWQARLLRKEVTETKARSLLRYADRPDVLAAISDDFDNNPAAYETREQFESRTAFIGEQFDSLEAGEAKLVRGDGDPQRRKAAEPPPARRKAAEPPLARCRPFRLGDDRFKPFLAVVDPFRTKLEALRILRELVDGLILQLEKE